MLGRIFRMFANTYLRNRRAETGRGPSRLPPTSVGEAQNRAVGGAVRAIMNRFMKR